MRTYAIGDIHGQLDLLKALHDRIAADQAAHGAAPIVHVGDLVDRGPNSAGVIQYLIDGMAAGQDWVVIKGNHDRMFTGFLDDMQRQDPGLRSDLSWLHPKLGGAFTLASYGVINAADRRVSSVHAEAVAAVPAQHRAFLTGLPTSLRRGGTVFVHAGIRPGIPLEKQTETDLVWIRNGFLDDTRDHGALIVHGHTVVPEVTRYSNRLNIDTGAAYGGPLSAVVIEDGAVCQLTDTGRLMLRPVSC